MDFLIDRSWMYIGNRVRSDVFKAGLRKFIEFALIHQRPTRQGKLICPCKVCLNRYLKTEEEVFSHVLQKGFVHSYDVWTFHGEVIGRSNPVVAPNMPSTDNMHQMLEDLFGMGDTTNDHSTEATEEPANVDAQRFYKILKEADQPLYRGCTSHSKLSYLVALLFLKEESGWSNDSFTKLLQLIILGFPEENCLFSETYYEENTIMKDL